VFGDEMIDLTKTHVVSFSGGRTSAYLVHLMEFYRLFMGADVHYVFMDTGAEHPKTYEFIKQIVAEWKLPLRCIRTKVNPKMGKGCGYREVSVDDIGPDLEPWKEMLVKYGSPAVSMPYCTARMKTDPYNAFCKEHFGDHITWLGLRVDEPKRLKKKEGIRFLAELSDFDKEDVLDWWKQQPFDLQIKEHLGNCVFCIKKSELKLALAEREEPELCKEFIALTEGPMVRSEGRKFNHHRMYRKDRHLSDIIVMFSDASDDDIKGRLRHMRYEDTGSCSESCEVFNLEED